MKHGILLCLLLAAGTLAAGAGHGSPGSGRGDVPASDIAFLAATRAHGRRIGDLVAKGQAQAIFDQFTPQMAANVSEKTLAQVLDSTTAARKVGALAGDSVHGDATDSSYIADYAWNGQRLRLSVDFAGDGRIAGLVLTPRSAQPQDPHAGYRTKTALRLPFDGTWWVFWGGDDEAQNYHVISADQRHAYDFLIRRGGVTHREGGTRNKDYFAWGQPVLAPADAVVTEAVDALPDNTPGVMDPEHAAGNHVMLDFGDGEYALLAHLQHGSLRVHAGDHVRMGQRIGLCGNSGNTSEPHVHMHLQDDKPLFHGARGLPLAFVHYSTDGKAIPSGEPAQGQFIRNF